MNQNTSLRMAVENETSSPSQFLEGQVISKDGTCIGYRQTGTGPGLVILHGGARASQHYIPLAEALAGEFTVVIPDRRGRGLSGVPGNAYSIDKEMEDLSAILQATGASSLFGHSAGGFFALEAALRLPVERLALYEPALSIHGSLPFDWLPPYEQALARNDPGLAFAHLVKGLQLNQISSLPIWMLAPFARLMIRSDEGQEMAVLLPTMVWEAKEFQRLEQAGLTYERYQAISARTLLLGGTRSPAYLLQALRAVEKTIPLALLVELDGLDHNAPDQNAPQAVAAQLKSFLSYR